MAQDKRLRGTFFNEREGTMSIPRVFYIDGHKWTIKQLDQASMKDIAIAESVDFKYKENIYGFPISKINLFVIDKDLKDTEKMATILHEIIHIVAPKLSEAEVLNLERGLYSTLHLNKNLKF